MNESPEFMTIEEPLPNPTPRELLEDCIQTHDIPPSHLIRIFGSLTAVQHILYGNEEGEYPKITHLQAQHLSELFKLPKEGFLDPDRHSTSGPSPKTQEPTPAQHGHQDNDIKLTK